MYRVYECELPKKGDVMSVLEADPYQEDSFARIGYKAKDGSTLGEDKGKFFVYLSAPEETIKKCDEKLKELAKPAPQEVQDRIGEKIRKEEEEAEAGLGSIFGQ